MKSRYDSFSVFMAEVVKNSKNGINYKVATVVTHAILEVLNYTGKILDTLSWGDFLGLCGFLALGKIAFAAVIITIVCSPIGVALATICYEGASTALWCLYKNRELPFAIKEIGNKYKDKYKTAKSHYEIDNLLYQASNDLCKKLLEFR